MSLLKFLKNFILLHNLTKIFFFSATLKPDFRISRAEICLISVLYLQNAICSWEVISRTALAPFFFRGGEHSIPTDDSVLEIVEEAFATLMALLLSAFTMITLTLSSKV